MVNTTSFQVLNKSLLQIIVKIIRYRHHIVFISAYLKYKSIQKGFKLKFHSNIPGINTDVILKKCSRKLMEKTLNHHKKSHANYEKRSMEVAEKIVTLYPDKKLYIRNIFNNKLNSLAPTLEKKRKSKFHRDNVNYISALAYSSNLMKSFKCLDYSDEVKSKLPADVHFPILINTGNTEISNDFKELCSKGPSFVPTPVHFDWLQLQKDFDNFRNRVRARFIFSADNHHANSTKDDSKNKNPPKKQSQWSAPKTSSPEIETFLSNVERTLFENTSRKDIRNNLSKKERSSLNFWRKNQLFNKESKLVMRTQDKGNRFVIVDKSTDKLKANEQIMRSSFVELEHDPTKLHIEKVKLWAEKWHQLGEISKDWKNYVINTDAKPGKNSTLYKTHKPGNPVRLLTSGCNTAIENLARFVEVICAPLAENLPSRIKNTSHLLDIIDHINGNGISNNTTLVSFDIVNMFPSIDNTKGIKAIKDELEKRNEKNPSTKCVIEGLEICLFNNNSIFDNKNLLQTNGTATGAPNSCSYSDIAVSKIDDAVFKEMKSKYKELKYYGRYRDDCFALWEGNSEKLHQFFDFINSLDNDLKFTMEIGNKELCFLDVKISIIDRKLETTVYSKPTDSHLYLHATSCHNQSSITGIPKGVSLRLRRLCSTDVEYDKQSKEYTDHLKLRGYNENMVSKSFENTRKTSRFDARKKVENKRNTNAPIIFSTAFNPRGPNVKEVVNRFLPLLQNVPNLKDMFADGSILVANKRENNLADLLLRSDPYNIKNDITNQEEHGYLRCSKKCDSCDNFVIQTSFITCNATGRKYSIRRSSSCTTKNVVYVACCQYCGKQGVGSTVSWKPRLANYKSHIKKKVSSCRIASHFIEDCKSDDLSNLKFIIVDVVNGTNELSCDEIDSLLLQKEKFWIGTLVSQHKGLNGSHDWNRKKRTEREKFQG